MTGVKKFEHTIDSFWRLIIRCWYRTHSNCGPNLSAEIQRPIPTLFPPNHIIVDETVIQLNNYRLWLFAVVNPETNKSSNTAVSGHY